MEVGVVDPSLSMKKAVLPEPSKIIYADSTFRGKVRSVIADVKDSYGKYFHGKDPMIKTKPEEEASKVQ